MPPAAALSRVPDTPFVAGDPSIERIVDEEETAANGEMFKDARLQERLFDQIHAVEFNLEDDFRSAEVGSLLSSGGLVVTSFERIDDGEADAEPIREAAAAAEAHVSSFIDDVDADTLSRGRFPAHQRRRRGSGDPEVEERPASSEHGSLRQPGAKRRNVLRRPPRARASVEEESLEQEVFEEAGCRCGER